MPGLTTPSNFTRDVLENSSSDEDNTGKIFGQNSCTVLVPNHTNEILYIVCAMYGFEKQHDLEVFSEFKLRF